MWFLPVRAVALLWGFFLTLIPSLIGRILIALGVSYVTYKGFNVSIDWLLAQIKTNFAGMPVEVAGLLGYLWVDKAIGMIFSAFSAALVIRSISGGSITKMVIKTAANNL